MNQRNEKFDWEENPFEVLGVTVSASMDEVTAAWREKAKGLHPDRFPNVSRETTELLNREMARVNSAYTRIKSDPEGQRRLFSQKAQSEYHGSAGPTAPEEKPSRHRARRNRVLSCDLCGSLNTAEFEFTRQVGLFFQRRYGTVSSRLCRSCALAIGRDFQSRTLTTGWWGVFAFVANIGYVVKNAKELRKALDLSDPAPPAGFVTFPLYEGKPVMRRAFSWVGLAIFAVSLAFSAFEDSSGINDTAPINQPSPQASWSVGNCVSGYGMVIPVPCSEPHSGRIIGAVTRTTDCPSAADSYVSENSMYFCIDSTP